MSVANACGLVTINHRNPHNLDQSFVIIIIIIIIKGMPAATGL
jgi:hypothetical protein